MEALKNLFQSLCGKEASTELEHAEYEHALTNTSGEETGEGFPFQGEQEHGEVDEEELLNVVMAEAGVRRTDDTTEEEEEDTSTLGETFLEEEEQGIPPPKTLPAKNEELTKALKDEEEIIDETIDIIDETGNDAVVNAVVTDNLHKTWGGGDEEANGQSTMDAKPKKSRWSFFSCAVPKASTIRRLRKRKSDTTQKDDKLDKTDVDGNEDQFGVPVGLDGREWEKNEGL